MTVVSRETVDPPNVMATERIILFNVLMTVGIVTCVTSWWLWSEFRAWQLHLIALVLFVGGVAAVLRSVRIAIDERAIQRSFLKVWREADGGHSARFLSAADLEAAGCFDGGRLIGMFKNRPLFAPTKVEQSHSLIVAANGSGKTSCGVVPTILSLAHEMAAGRHLSACVTDIKSGEIIHQVGPVLEDLGIDYVVLDDFGVMKGHPRTVAINPFGELAWVRQHEPRSFRRQIDKVMHTLWPSPAGGVGQNEYFYAEPRNRGAMAIEDLASIPNVRFEPGAVWTVLNDPDLWTARLKVMAKSGPEHLRGEAKKVLQYMADEHEHEPSHIGAAVRAFSPFASGGWLHELVPRNGKKPLFQHRELMCRPCMLFIVGRSDLVSDARAFFGLHLQAVMHAQLTSPFFEVHYLAEEAANSPLKEMTDLMQSLRGLGARIHVITQSKTGLEIGYGARATRVIFNEAIVKQYFGFTAFDEAKELSEAIGREVVIKPSLSQSSGVRRMGRSWSVSREPLMSADKLMSLPYDEQIIHIGRLGFVQCKKVHSSEIGPYAARLGRNVVENRDATVNIKFNLGAVSCGRAGISFGFSSQRRP